MVKSGEKAFTKMKLKELGSQFRIDEDEEDDAVEEVDLENMQYFNGTSEILKLFSRKCVRCFENPSVCAFHLRGHQCICEKCYGVGMLI